MLGTPQASLGLSTPGPALTASIDKNPYGINPLFTPSAPVPAPSTQIHANEPAIIPPKPLTEKKKPILTPHFKVTPKSASKIRLRGFAGSPTLPPSSLGTGPLIGSESKGMKPSLQPPPVLLQQSSPATFDTRFTPRKTMTKLILTETPEPSVGSTFDVKIRSAPPKEVTFDPSLEESALSFIKDSESLYKVRESPQSTSAATSVINTPHTPAKSSEYEIEPPLSDLFLLSDEELHSVEHFKVSLPGVGSVKFLKPVDLLQASPTGTRSGIEQIPGSIIILEPKICTVYPDEDVKPPVGFGLNVTAEINLEKCWPLDKSTRKPILDESDPRHDSHMRKLERMAETKWLGFHNPTGTWRFIVDHFSRYGLVDDDEESNHGDGVVPTPGMKSVDVGMEGNSELEEESILKDSFAHIKKYSLSPLSPQDEQDDQEDYDDDDYDEEDDEEIEQVMEFESLSSNTDEEYEEEEEEYEEEHSMDSHKSPLHLQDTNIESEDSDQENMKFKTNTFEMKNKARKVQAIKAAFFSTTSQSLSPKKPESSSTLLEFKRPIIDHGNAKRSEQEVISESDSNKETPSRADFDHGDVLSGPSPRKYMKHFLSHTNGVVPLKESMSLGLDHDVKDVGLCMSRSFRVGWGPNGVFVCK